MRRSIKADPNRRAYTDLALTPVADDELDKLEMFQVSAAAKASAAKARRTAEAASPAGA